MPDAGLVKHYASAPRSSVCFLVQRKQGKAWVFCPDIAPLYDQTAAHLWWDRNSRDVVAWRILIVEGARSQIYLG